MASEKKAAPVTETAPLLSSSTSTNGVGRSKSKLNVAVSADDLADESAAGSAAAGALNDGDEEAEKQLQEKLIQAAKLRKWLMWMMLATILVLIAIVITGIVLRRNKPTNYTIGCPSAFDSKADYFPNKVEIREANVDFTVDYALHYKTVTNKFADETYILVQCNTYPPAIGGGAKEFFITPTVVGSEVPLVAHAIELIGRRTSITQEGGVSTVTSPCLQYMIENDIVEELRRINDEELEVIFMGDSANAGGTKEIIVSAALEESPLQAVEWLQFVGAVYNLEKEALEVVDGIRERYNCRRRASGPGPGAPVVAWTRKVVINGTIESWRVETDSWREVLVFDAGGAPFYFQNGTFTDLTIFQEKVLQESDVIIDFSGTITTYDEFLSGYGVNASQTDKYPFLQNQAVYRLDGRVNAGGSTEWSTAAIFEPDVALADMVAVVDGSGPRRWLRKLATEEYQAPGTVLTSAQCPDVSPMGLTNPVPPLGSQCS